MEEIVIDTKEKSDKVFFGQSFVAFLDILGFKSLVGCNSHEDLIQIYEELIAKTVSDIQRIEKEVETSAKEELGDLYEPVGIRLINVSDSIILWTQNCRKDSLYNIILTVRNLLTLTFKLGIPLRGVIGIGNLSAIEKGGNISLVGQGLINAYITESNYNWAGVVIDEGVFSYLNSLHMVVMRNSHPINFDPWSEEMVKYDVPTKKDPLNCYVVNWTNFIHFEEQEIVDSFSKHKKREREDEALRVSTDTKIQNTIDFWKKFKPN